MIGPSLTLLNQFMMRKRITDLRTEYMTTSIEHIEVYPVYSVISVKSMFEKHALFTEHTVVIEHILIKPSTD